MNMINFQLLSSRSPILNNEHGTWKFEARSKDEESLMLDNFIILTSLPAWPADRFSVQSSLVAGISPKTFEALAESTFQETPEQVRGLGSLDRAREERQYAEKFATRTQHVTTWKKS